MHGRLQGYAPWLPARWARPAAGRPPYTLAKRRCRGRLIKKDRAGRRPFPLTRDFGVRLPGGRQPVASVAAGALLSLCTGANADCAGCGAGPRCHRLEQGARGGNLIQRSLAARGTGSPDVPRAISSACVSEAMPACSSLW